MQQLSSVVGRASVAQSTVITDQGVMSLIPTRPHTFVLIDHEIFSLVILLLPLIQEGLLLVKNQSMCTKYWLTAQSKLTQEKCIYFN